jgi:ABC-type Zn uptake system ZnuABC Zn-binding protein ZnuA
MHYRVTLSVIGMLLLLGGLFLAGRWVSNQQSLSSIASTKMQVTTSFYPLYFFTKDIAGGDADVKKTA